VTEASLLKHTTKDGWRRGQTIDAVLSDIEQIDGLKSEFFSKIWADGLQKAYMQDRARGMRASANGTAMLLYCLAGRVSMQLERKGGTFIHLLTTDEEPPRPFGLQGIGCTLGAATSMFRDVQQAWHAGQLKLRRDDDVRMI